MFFIPSFFRPQITVGQPAKRLYIDISGEYSLSRRVGLFANLRNINDATEDQEVAGPSTPAQAQFRQRLDFGSLWTFGLKGTF